MCDKCFLYEIRSFIDEESFKIVNDKIKLLLGSMGLNHVRYFEGDFIDSGFKILGIGFGGEIIHDYNEYECLFCHQKWKVSWPENAWRGFLLKSENYY